MDSYPLVAGDAVAAVIVVPEQDRVLLVGRRKGNPFPERVFGPPEAGKLRRRGGLRLSFPRPFAAR